jgi:SAM-dependent methyltransferase
MTAPDAAVVGRRIAARYRLHPHRSYVRGKLRWDPLFAAVAPLLVDSPRGLLDVGCGFGLFGQYLRECGFRARYCGVDLDERKIAEARGAAAGLDLEFAIGSATSLPRFSGDVSLFDVLHYLSAEQQQLALAQAAACVPADGLIMIRNVLREPGWRFRTTIVEERLARALRWMRYPVTHYPEREEIEAPLRAAGFVTRVTPLWGRTPFNSYLFLARRE